MGHTGSGGRAGVESSLRLITKKKKAETLSGLRLKTVSFSGKRRYLVTPRCFSLIPGIRTEVVALKVNQDEAGDKISGLCERNSSLGANDAKVQVRADFCRITLQAAVHITKERNT